jgi:chorismate synthase
VLRFLTAGESHGPALVAVIEGLPAGLPITIDDVSAELARRRLGFGRGPRMKIEQDEVEFLGGVRHGRTLGSPVAIAIRNTEWPKWSEEMSPAPGRTEKPLTRPRPGHADLVGMQKYGFDDARDVLERASARETAARRGCCNGKGVVVTPRCARAESRGAARVRARRDRPSTEARGPRGRRRVIGPLLRS